MPPRMRRRITTAKREEIEAEQRLLDKQIVRPFETLEGLPISYNKPPHGHYEEVLKNPLTIKDSAVLYNSLIRSRNTYVFHAPMFKLYWVKQTAYAKKLAEMEKGPQPSKERETRRKFAKATSNSLEAKTRTPILSGDVNARDVMSKLCEASLSLGPHSMEIRIFIAKDARSEKSKAFSEISQVSDGSDLLMRKSSPPPPPPPASDPASSATASSATASSLHPEQSPMGAPVASSATTTSPTASAPSAMSAPPTNPSQPPSTESSVPSSTPPPSKVVEEKEDSHNISSTQSSRMVPDKDTSIEPSKAEGSTQESKPSQPKGDTDQHPKDEADKKNTAKSSSPPNTRGTAAPTSSASTTDAPSNPAGSGAPQAKTPQAGPPKPSGAYPRPPPPRTVDMTSVDNAIMISNLNAIAKIDLSLNDLMKVVAKGTASEAQINLFKRYIERAKQMGPQPHHAELYFVRGLPLPLNFPRPYVAKQFVQPRPPKPRFNNPMKLTAFQEKYLHNATLVFEFLENPNVRYVIPRDSICEVLPPSNPVTLEDGSGVKDVLFSNIWIHNIEDVEAYEQKLKLYQDELKRKEEEEKARKQEEEKAAENDGGNETQCEEQVATEVKVEEEPRPQRSSRSGRNKKPPPTRKRTKPLEPPEEPQVRFTTYSFTVHGIPEKFVPIVVNSMRPINLVQEKMEKILKIGNRVSPFHLWYQVDAKLDEGVAEDLRQSIILEEKKMAGVVPQSVEREQPKKRKREFKNPRAKKAKEDSPSTVSGTPVPPYSGNVSVTPTSQSTYIQNGAPPDTSMNTKPPVVADRPNYTDIKQEQ